MSEALTEDDLVHELHRLAAELGHPPSANEMNDKGRFSHAPFYRVFEGWAEALEAAGFHPRPESKRENQRVSKQTIINEIRRLHDIFGRPPSVREFREFTDHSDYTVNCRFGSYNDGVREAGFEPAFESVEDREASAYQYHWMSNRWQKRRDEVLERDDYECQRCGIANEDNRAEFGVGLNVHHKTPVREFDTAAEADQMANLVTLCSKCHVEAES